MTESVLDYMTRLGRAAREASRVIGRASTAQKTAPCRLLPMRWTLPRRADRSQRTGLAAGRANGLEPALLERLALTPRASTA
jgi:glutamate-5-semialdehyde dehydrogenase